MRGVPLVLALVACTGSRDDKDDGTDRTVTDASETDTDTDDGGNTGTQGSDTDTTPGSTTPYALDCSADYASTTPAPGSAGACFTQEIACGDVIYASTDGGDAIYDADYWITRQMSSTLDSGDLTGPERVYWFRGLEPDDAVTFTVTGCADLWATTILYGDVSGEPCDTSDTFSTAQHFDGVGTTTMEAERTNGTVGGSYDLAVIVDTVSIPTNFVLTVTCGDHG